MTHDEENLCYDGVEPEREEFTMSRRMDLYALQQAYGEALRIMNELLESGTIGMGDMTLSEYEWLCERVAKFEEEVHIVSPVDGPKERKPPSKG